MIMIIKMMILKAIIDNMIMGNIDDDDDDDDDDDYNNDNILFIAINFVKMFGD